MPTSEKLKASLEVLMERDILRKVDIEGFILETYDTHRQDRYGKCVLGYSFTNPQGEVLFSGEDFCCSPMDSIDSDDCLRSLLSFLTMRPGDTDPEYFEGYTEKQLEFCSKHAENLSLYSLDPEEFDDPSGFTFKDVEF